jgi:hypothetical protein
LKVEEIKIDKKLMECVFWVDSNLFDVKSQGIFERNLRKGVFISHDRL